jgi:hypothetical protein
MLPHAQELRRTTVGLILALAVLPSILLSAPQARTKGHWPQSTAVKRDDAAGTLTLSTLYYAVTHDLKKGGAIVKISYTNGRAANLLVQPIETSVELEDKKVTAPYSGPGSLPAYADLNDAAPAVSHQTSGESEIVTVRCRLLDKTGRDSGVTTQTTYTYRWGFIKIHKDVLFPETPTRIKTLGVFSTSVHPSLSEYGYRNGVQERVFANLWSWRSEIIQWRKMRAGSQLDNFLQTRHLPRYLVFANPGVEGLEWFMGDDLSQWDYQMTGQPGTSFGQVSSSRNPLGVAVSISPVSLYKGSVAVKGAYAFDYYLGMPILEGHAYNPWLNQRVAINGGKWVSEEEIKAWAEAGINVVTLHNDGPSRDGLFWRDGSYPPYPPEEMKKMDQVIDLCHKYGIKIAPYFSNHELFSTVEEYKAHGDEWKRIVDDTGTNIDWRYGYYMCLKSGWLDFFKLCVDRVLKNHKFDGVYYDWNLALYCNNPLHMGKTSNGVTGDKGLGALALSPTGHWDQDELLELVEWTRRRVGPDGLVLLHDTLVPMFALENFADYVVGMEFGYNLVSESFPKLGELPLEWNFVGARSRAAISGGVIDSRAPRRLHQHMALSGLLTAVAPWRATPEATNLFKVLKPLGNLEQYKFEDWRNAAVRLEGTDCASAVYSRAREAFVILANFNAEPRTVSCRVAPGALPSPLAGVSTAEIIAGGAPARLDAGRLTGGGENVTIPGDGAVVLRLK